MEIRKLFSKERNIDAKQKRRLRHKLLTFLVCLTISFSFWALLSYSQKGSEFFSVVVTGKNPPDGFLLTNQSARTISFQTRTSLQSIENIRKRSRNEQIVIDLSRVDPVPSRNNNYLATLDIEPFVDDYLRKLGYNGKFDNLSPDSVVFAFERGAKKRVPVRMQVEYAIAEQSRQFSPAVVQPDSVWIFGSKETIDTVVFVYSKRLKLGNIQDTTSRMIALERLSDANISADSVYFTIPAGEVTEKNIIVPISTDLADASSQVKLIPDQASLSCLVPIKRFSEITPEMFVVKAKQDTLNNQNGNVMCLQVEKIPESVEVIRTIPETVNYILFDEE